MVKYLKLIDLVNILLLLKDVYNTFVLHIVYTFKLVKAFLLRDLNHGTTISFIDCLVISNFFEFMNVERKFLRGTYVRENFQVEGKRY